MFNKGESSITAECVSCILRDRVPAEDKRDLFPSAYEPPASKKRVFGIVRIIGAPQARRGRGPRPGVEVRPKASSPREQPEQMKAAFKIWRA